VVRCLATQHAVSLSLYLVGYVPNVGAFAAIGWLLAGAVLWYTSRGDGARGDAAHGDAAPEDSAPPDSPSANASPDSPAYAIDVPPSLGEVAHGDLIYAVVAGSVQRRGDGMRVWLRIRASNEGFYNANFWDQSFRLVAGGQTVAPNGGLNVVLDRRSIQQGVIRFDLAKLFDAIRTGVAQFDANAGRQIDEVLEQGRGMTGLDLQKDVLAPLGDEWAYYSDPTTGGKGFLGFTIVNRLRDPKKAEASLTRLQEVINAIVQQQLADEKVTIAFKQHIGTRG
jgi:hypothetical protein